MHRFTVGLLVFVSGWGLGWYANDHWGADPVQPAQHIITAPSKPVYVEEPAAEVTLSLLLQRDEFETAVERYESLQVQAGDVVVADARTKILSHARQLNAEHRFGLAEQLLQRFLVAAYRDVEARILLAGTYQGKDDYYTAIDQLYEARGYAYRPAMLQRITVRIRTIVAELTRSLKRNNDQNALLALYQHLTRIEPDHAPWFLGLANAQMALDDKEAARRSLLLVSQDPAVGVQAQAMLSALTPALAEPQSPEPGVSAVDVAAGIPLRRRGNNFIVDAGLARGQKVQLLIDTGASLTIFTPDVLEQRGIRYRDTGRIGVFNTANGRVQAPVYMLDSLTVGDWQVNQLEVGVLDLGGQSDIDGLLGMNFLSHFQFFIDQNEALLRLSGT